MIANEVVTKELEELKIMILELKARLTAESSQRSQVESTISVRVAALEAKLAVLS
ncbi:MULTISPECIES: hypothetical protein [Pseudomonas]|uniref:Uncharacterized protein n=1 Tax=Pseudomonas canadensis TaxID=915099 RepID=A0ABZ0ZZS2_9PSED|nr:MULTISPECIES: hypothetical protein [Pseudomonas]WRI22586.1 hypothetical protein SPL95_18425 [Pseudomonas canadensis]